MANLGLGAVEQEIGGLLMRLGVTGRKDSCNGVHPLWQ